MGVCFLLCQHLTSARSRALTLLTVSVQGTCASSSGCDTTIDPLAARVCMPGFLCSSPPQLHRCIPPVGWRADVRARVPTPPPPPLHQS